MSRFRLAAKYISEFGHPNTDWPEPPCIEHLSPKKKAVYSNRVNMVLMYFDGVPISEITRLTGISASEINRLVRKCLTHDSELGIYGFNALLPYKNTNGYKRKNDFNGNKGVGCSGLFNKFLEDNPDIREMIEDAFLHDDTERISVRKKRRDKIYDDMITMCTDKKLFNEYPLCIESDKNTSPPGKRALYRHLKKLENSNYILYAKKNLSKDAVTEATTTGKGKKNQQLPPAPLAVCEMDGHKLDGIFKLTVPSPEGDLMKYTFKRLWILVILDINTRAVLGYHVCVGDEYSGEDVRRCIRNAIQPHKPISFTIKGAKYPENGGFISTACPEIEWAVFDELRADNAKAHKTKEVRKLVTETLNANYKLGRVGTPTSRPYIEKFFDTFEEMCFHYLPNTTGNNPSDSRRNSPEKQALKYDMTVEEAIEMVELTITTYNNTAKNKALYGYSPIKAMQSRLSLKQVPRILDQSERENVCILKDYYTLPVCGSKEKGQRPLVNYQYTQYTSSKLADCWDLIDQNIQIEVNLDDATCVKAYLEDGTFLDVLDARSKWAAFEHDFNTRKYLLTQKHTEETHPEINPSPADIYLNHLSEKNTAIKSGCQKSDAVHGTVNNDIPSLNVDVFNEEYDMDTSIIASETLLYTDDDDDMIGDLF